MVIKDPPGDKPFDAFLVRLKIQPLMLSCYRRCRLFVSNTFSCISAYLINRPNQIVPEIASIAIHSTLFPWPIYNKFEKFILSDTLLVHWFLP